MYVFVYCLKLTSRPEIATHKHICQLFVKCCHVINQIVNFTIRLGLHVLYMYKRLLEQDQISHTQSMVADERGCTNRANVHTPM